MPPGTRQPRFVALTALSGTVWAGYSVGIGAVAGTWFQHNHLLGVAVAVGIAVGIGVLVDRASALVRGSTPLEVPAVQLGDEPAPARGTSPP